MTREEALDVFRTNTYGDARLILLDEAIKNGGSIYDTESDGNYPAATMTRKEALEIFRTHAYGDARRIIREEILRIGGIVHANATKEELICAATVNTKGETK